MRDARLATDSAPFPATTLRLLASLLIWAAHLGVIYAATALVCARGGIGMSLLGIGILAWIIGVATLAALAAVLWLSGAAIRSVRRAAHPRGSTPWFLDWVAATMAALAAVAILWQALPILIVRPCA
jgi:hypothetical protein